MIKISRGRKGINELRHTSLKYIIIRREYPTKTLIVELSFYVASTTYPTDC